MWKKLKGTFKRNTGQVEIPMVVLVSIFYRLMCSGANGANAKVGFRYIYEV